MSSNHEGTATLALPLSGLRLEWRDRSRSWRVQGAGVAQYVARDWVEWHPDQPTLLIVPLYWSPEGPRQEWWALIGAARRMDPVVEVSVEDALPSVFTLGPIWAVEWLGPSSVAEVSIDGEPQRVNFRRRQRRGSFGAGGWTALVPGDVDQSLPFCIVRRVADKAGATPDSWMAMLIVDSRSQDSLEGQGKLEALAWARGRARQVIVEDEESGHFNRAWPT